MCTFLMVGVVAGYSKHHTYLGSPQLREEKPRRRRIKVIRPKPKWEAIQYIVTHNKTT